MGKQLAEQCASTVKKVSLELGGNAPFIVFDDADLDAAIEGLIASKFRNSGQTCVCTNRVFVQAAIAQAFNQKLAQRMARLNIGAGFKPAVDIGPLINHKAVEKVDHLVQQAISEGATLLAGGALADDKESLNTYQPTLLANAKDTMDIAQQEIFGPVVAIYEFNSEEEVIERANNTPYGLAAYFYSNNMSRIWRVSEALDYGMVGVNAGVISSEVAPFGGIKESGLGREGSKYGMEDFLEIKYVCLDLGE